MKLSIATQRAQTITKENSNWYCGFEYTHVNGIGYEEGIHRRDPSSIIKINNLYYVWYTKSYGPYFGKLVTNRTTKQFPWDYADIYYAVSTDCINWVEKGCAVKRGCKGEYDERTVCTPDILVHNKKYYLVYQSVAQGIYTGTNESVSLAMADSPDGPWIKMKTNILSPMKDGRWFDGLAINNYNDDYFTGRVHDPSLFYYNNKFYLYYKCAASHQRIKFAGYDTRWGVAISDNIKGPYIHSEYNPITNSGHETMLWKYKGGIAALLNRDGPEKNTIQYAKDGINFEIMSVLDGNTPQAGGAYRTECYNTSPLEGIRWGLCHVDERGSKWNYIMRFDLDQRNQPYVFPLEYPEGTCQSIE